MRFKEISHVVDVKYRTSVTAPKDLVDAAHQSRPYSNATRGNVDVGVKLA